MASFQSKIGWKRLWKREKTKIILSFHSYSTRDRKFQKYSKKIQKIKRYHYGFISSFLVRKVWERGKIKLSFRSVPTRCIMENSKKITKKLKNTVVASFQAKIRCKKAVKERKQKLSIHSIPTRRVIENSKKIAKKSKN